MLNFNLPEKGLGLVSAPHFVYNFPIIYSTNQISLSDCLWFSRYWAICVLQLFANQAVTSQNLSYPYLGNQVVLLHDQKFKYLENEKSFSGEIKNFFHHF